MERDWEKLRKWIIRRRLEGMPVSSICTQAKISRKVFYFWWNRYQTQGWKGLKEEPKGRPSGPAPDDFLKNKVIKLRARYEWGPKKIAGCLKHKGYDIDNNLAYRIICEAGLTTQYLCLERLGELNVFNENIVTVCGKLISNYVMMTGG